jgi:hypothetical protein
MANWESVKNENMLDIRSFIDFFDPRRLNPEISDRSNRFVTFINCMLKNLKNGIWMLENFHTFFNSFIGNYVQPPTFFFNTSISNT